MLKNICPNCFIEVENRGDNYYCEYCDEEYTVEEIIWKEDDTEDDIPRGCAACGGPYPKCKISCNIFDK